MVGVRGTPQQQQQQSNSSGMVSWFYSITDLEDGTESTTTKVDAVEGELIHQFAARVLKVNAYEGRVADVFPSGNQAKACARADAVAAFIPASGIEDKPFLVHLKKAQQQPPAAEVVQKIANMAEEYARKEGSISLNDARTCHQREVLTSSKLVINGARWNSKPQNLGEISSFAPYAWKQHNGELLAEDHNSNRLAYMKHLKNHVNLPPAYAFYDAQPTRNLLDVATSETGFPRNIKGTTDVVVSRSENVTNGAVRNNVVALLELEKTNKFGNHEPQVCLELFAAAILNPDEPVLACYTDLNNGWMFYWFGPGDVKKLVLSDQPKLAKYLLDSITKREDAPETLPESFIGRLSWNEVQTSLRVAASVDPRAAGNDSNEKQSGNPSGGGHEPPSRKRDSHDDKDHPGDDTNKNTQQTKYPKTEASGSNLASGLRLLCPHDDVADELDLLDMVDEDTRTQTVRQFIAMHIIPQLTGAYPEALSIDMAAEKDPPLFLSAANLAQHDRLPL